MRLFQWSFRPERANYPVCGLDRVWYEGTSRTEDFVPF